MTDESRIKEFAGRIEQLFVAIEEKYGEAFAARRQERIHEELPPKNSLEYALHFANYIDDCWYYRRHYKPVVLCIHALPALEEQFSHLDPDKNHREVKLFLSAFAAMADSLLRLDFPKELALDCYLRALVLARKVYDTYPQLSWTWLVDCLSNLAKYYRAFDDVESASGLMDEVLSLYELHHTNEEQDWFTREYQDYLLFLKEILVVTHDTSAIDALMQRSLRINSC